MSSKFVTQNGLIQKQANNNNNNHKNNATTTIHNIINIEPPSSFIPFEEILAIDISNDETIAEIFAELYAQDGEIDCIFQIMSFHTTFLKDFLHFYNYLMYSQGALAYDSRHYLAIIAASRHKCFYLIKQQEKEYKQRNGNLEWLNSIDNIPQKLKDLYELNKILAHQPWLINHQHIAKILRGQYKWSVTELIMAITILTNFHALSGFVFGCGINDKFMQIYQSSQDLNADIDTNNNNNDENQNLIQNQNTNVNFSHLASSSPPVLSERNLDYLLKEMQMIKSDELNNNKKVEDKSKENNPMLNRNNNYKHNTANSNNNNNNNTLTGSGVNNSNIVTSAASKTFDNNANNNCSSAIGDGSGGDGGVVVEGDGDCDGHVGVCGTSGNNLLEAVNNYILKYTYDPDYTHQDFRNADPTLKLEYYTWEHHGYITGCSLYPEISNLIDQTFRTAYNMPYKTVDTSLFRRAVWIYIHSIFGIRYDDYDYGHIKQLLALPLRNFIKIVCLNPDRINKKDYDSIMKEFSHSDKVHLNIVIMEARMQASMLYFFRAITQYYYNSLFTK